MNWLRIGVAAAVLGIFGGPALCESGPRPPEAWSWPDRATADAVRDGLLTLEVGGSPQQIATWQRVDVRIRLINRGDKKLSVPADWPNRLGAEIVAVDDPGRVLTWQRPVPPAAAVTPMAPGDPGWLHTAVWFASEPLRGQVEEWPYLGPGRFKWRPVLWGDPVLRGPWTPLEVVKPALSAEARKAAAQRPGGNLILVAANRNCPKPTGSADRPFRDLADALRSAKAGDVVFCEPGAHSANPCVVPDDVWLVGNGAANTVVTVIGQHNAVDQKCVQVNGKARVEGLTLRAKVGRGALVYCTGEASKPTICQCALLPADNDFSAVTAWDKAAPVLRNCIIVSPVGDYGVFARNGARPTVERCTIISRGFGVGMMDGAVPTIRRSIIAGRCPAVITDDGEFALTDSVIFCPVPGGEYFKHPVLRSRRAPSPEGQTTYESLDATLKRKDILNVDPQFVLKGGLLEFFSVRPGSAAAGYGAFSGPGGERITWPAGADRWPGSALPDMKESGLLALPSVGPARAVKVKLAPADPPTGTTYVLSADDLADVRGRVVELLTDVRPVTLDAEVRYSTGISHFDSWLPIPGEPQKTPPDRDHYRWGFLNGRVAKVEFVKGGKAELQFTVRYNELGAPVLCINHVGAGKGYVILADYDSRGLLCRLAYLSKSLDPVSVDVLENEAGYASTTHWSFTPQGKFISRIRYAGDDMLYLDTSGDQEKRVNGGPRLWWIRMLKRYGLASVYPIAAGQETVPHESAGQPRPAAAPPTTEPEAVAALAEQLLAEDQATRLKAAAALGDLGAKHKEAVAHLLRALSHPDCRLRVAAAQALDHIRWQLRQGQPSLGGDQVWPSDSEFVPPLVGMLADKNGEVRHVAMWCLIRIGRPARAAMPPLVGLYWFGTAQDRADSLSALGDIDPDDRASAAVFLDAAKSNDWCMRVLAAAAMSYVKVDPVGRGIVQALAKALEDETWNVRTQAAYALELLGPVARSAVPALKVAAQDSDERVRQHAAYALEVIQRESPKVPTSPTGPPPARTRTPRAPGFI